MKKTEIAYIAGLIDGDGHIGIVSRLKAKQGEFQSMAQYTLCVKLCLAHETAVRWVCDKVGAGSVTLNESKQTQKKSWMWFVAARSAADFLKVIEPYLIVKKRHAEIAAKFYATVGAKDLSANRRKFLSKKAAAIRIECVNEIRSLSTKRRKHAIERPKHSVPSDLMYPH